MAHDWLDQEDLSVFVVAGVPKGFNRKLSRFLEEEQGAETPSLRVTDELSPWILSRVRGHYRKSSSQSAASKALWRAFRALAAARYHLRGDEDREGALRTLRDEVEAHWMGVSPLHREVAAD